jgi:hypothetical protein
MSERTELIGAITEITGRRPRPGVSIDYLRQRLDMLTRRATSALHWQNELRRKTLGVRYFVVELDATRGTILDDIAAMRSTTPERVLLRSFDEHAVASGFGPYIERLRK